MNRAQPAEYQTHDQRAPTGGERERQTGNGKGEQSQEAAEHDPQTDEDHVRHHSLAIGVAEVLGRPLDVARSSDERHYIAPLHLRSGRERHRLASPGQFFQKDTACELQGCQIDNSFADEGLVGDHDVEHLDRKTQEFLVIYFGPDLFPAGCMQFRARQDRDDVTLAKSAFPRRGFLRHVRDKDASLQLEYFGQSWTDGQNARSEHAVRRDEEHAGAEPDR